ncbi:MAG: hypothetical protein RIR76_510 [Verrucomicrobiota bacterium]|jgi:predicted neuraminidase
MILHRLSNRAALAAVLAFAVLTARGAGQADPALQPASVNIAPGAAYGAATRPFQGIPGMARSPGGRLWATWYAGGTDEGPDNYVALATSTDDGRTWSEIQAVIDPPGDVRAYDPTLWIDPQGRLWWFYAQSFRWWDGRAGVWAVTTDEPDKASPRWSAPRRLADGIMMNKPTVLRNGDWLLPISIWTQEPAKDPKHARYVPAPNRKWDAARVGAHVYRSADRGATFSQVGSVRIPGPLFDEHMIVERRDGSLWLLARNRTGIAESTSTDGGRTWSEAKPSPIPHVSSRFFISRLQSGKLLLVKHNPRMDTSWLVGTSVPNVWQQRSHLTAYLSDDDGRSWHGGLVLDERVAVSYPDAQQAADGRIFLIYDFNRKTDKEVLLAVFSEADVAAGRAVSDIARFRLLVSKATGRAP